MCVSIDSDLGRVMLVVDGEALHDRLHQEALAEDSKRPLSLNITLGMTLHFVHEDPGLVTNLNMFSSALSKERMERLTTAGGPHCGDPGDYLSWQKADWKLHSRARLDIMDTPGACRKESSLHVYTAGFPDHSDCMEHCEKLGEGQSPHVRTLHQLETFRSELHSITEDISVLPWLWLPATDGDLEGEWRDYYTGERLENFSKPWYPGHDAKFGDDYNCLLWYTDVPDEEAWGEQSCNDHPHYGCPCQFSRQPILRLRGLCGGEQSLLDTTYLPKQINPKNMMLLGLYSANITYDEQTSQWTLSSSKSNISAVSTSNKVTYAIGKQIWKISGDSYKCNEGETYSTRLKLTGCRDGQFTCEDGQCIRMEERCDQLTDCRDESDEKGCILLILEEGYNKNVPPITKVSQSNRTTVPVKVKTSIVLYKIVSMEEVHHSIDFQFQITLRWKDNRVKFHNLKEDTSLNALTDAEIAELWLPLVIYDNTDQKETTRLGAQFEWSTSVTITREGHFNRGGLEEVDEVEIFKGKENTISMRQVYTHSFQCKYNLERYPFDTQVTFVN